MGVQKNKIIVIFEIVYRLPPPPPHQKKKKTYKIVTRTIVTANTINYINSVWF